MQASAVVPSKSSNEPPQVDKEPPHAEDNIAKGSQNNAMYQNQKCFHCGGARHPRSKCPARDSTCMKCKKIGHWIKVCRSQKNSDGNNNVQNKTTASSVLASMGDYPEKLRKSALVVTINNYKTMGLADSGSSDSFIDFQFSKTQLNLIVDNKYDRYIYSQNILIYILFLIMIPSLWLQNLIRLKLLAMLW